MKVKEYFADLPEEDNDVDEIDFKIEFNPNLPCDKRWKYTFIENDEIKYEIFRESKGRLMNVVIYKGLIWDPAKIVKIPLKPENRNLKWEISELREPESRPFIDWSKQKNSNLGSTPYGIWHKSNYRY